MLAFIHIPKTGGQTISKSLLRSAFGVRHCDVLPWAGENGTVPFSARDLGRVQKIHPKLESIAGHSVMLCEELGPAGQEVQYFAFVRNPIAQCVSHYQYQCTHKATNLTFDEWNQQEFFHNHQTKMLAGCEDVQRAVDLIHKKLAFIGISDRFDESLVIFRGIFAVHLNIAYQNWNIAKDKRIAGTLMASGKVRKAITQAYWADAELYEYISRDLYPSFQREYGRTLAQDLAAFQQKRNRVNRKNVIMNCTYRNLVYKPVLNIYQRYNYLTSR